MEHINGFEGSSFSEEKERIIKKIADLKKDYVAFTHLVSPRNWRSTGTHYAGLKKMADEVSAFEEISDKDKENEWVRKELERDKSED